MNSPLDRNLEFDLQALSGRLRADDAFAVEVYCALCNTDWRHVDGTTWHGSWRYSAGLVATLRGRGEDYIDFYCSGIRSRAEGTITERVAEAMAELGWTGTGHGSDHVYMTDFVAGETKVWVDGDWFQLTQSGIAERSTERVRADPEVRCDVHERETPQGEPPDPDAS